MEWNFNESLRRDHPPSRRQPNRRHLRIFWAKKYVTQNSESRKIAPSLCHRRGNMPTGAVKHSVPWGLKQLTSPDRECFLHISCSASSRTCPLYILHDAQFCESCFFSGKWCAMISADVLDLRFMYRSCLFLTKWPKQIASTWILKILSKQTHAHLKETECQAEPALGNTFYKL